MKFVFSEGEKNVIVGLLAMARAGANQSKNKEMRKKADKIISKIDGNRAFAKLKGDEVYEIYKILETCIKFDGEVPEGELQKLRKEDVEIMSSLKEMFESKLNEMV